MLGTGKIRFPGNGIRERRPLKYAVYLVLVFTLILQQAKSLQEENVIFELQVSQQNYQKFYIIWLI